MAEEKKDGIAKIEIKVKPTKMDAKNESL